MKNGYLRGLYFVSRAFVHNESLECKFFKKVYPLIGWKFFPYNFHFASKKTHTIASQNFDIMCRMHTKVTSVICHRHDIAFTSLKINGSQFISENDIFVGRLKLIKCALSSESQEVNQLLFASSLLIIFLYSKYNKNEHENFVIETDFIS